MDSLNIVNLKLEKANAILRHRRLQKITALFRFVEIFFLLIMISRFSVQLPFNFFRGLLAPLFSPRFVFVIGNAIIIILFLKSGCFGNKTNTDFCEEYVKNSVKNQIVCEIETEYQKKDEKEEVSHCNYREKKMHRSNSENLIREGGGEKEMPHRELRRSATDNCWKIAATGGCAEDEMSDQEFRLTVEAFIARQQRSLREEEFSATVG